MGNLMHLELRVFALVVFAALAFAASAPAAAAAGCERLSTLALPYARVVSADDVPVGALPSPRGGGDANAALCRVVVEVTYSSRATTPQLWMPVEGWNAKLLVAGSPSRADACRSPNVAGLEDGYAVAVVDHGGASRVAADRFRAIHHQVVAAKTIVTEWYGYRPRASYWNDPSITYNDVVREATTIKTTSRAS